jgi:hypothetical protein
MTNIPLRLLGKKFGRLTVMQQAPSHNGRTMWLCDCDCGTRGVAISGRLLKKGTTKSCGCLRGGRIRHGHGNKRSREYRCWINMRARCNDSNKQAYKWYGARGIRVCDRWNSFENFLADMGPKPPGHSLDRIDVNGNYEPSNCRWATKSEQISNRREYNSIAVKRWLRERGLEPPTDGWLRGA